MRKLSDYQHLIDQKFVSVKTDQLTGRSILKYGRTVFYKGLWLTDPLLVEARGHVFDAHGDQIVFPPTKVFNYLENNAGAGIPDDQRVQAVRKVNGFLACVTFVDGEMLVTTTGSLSSEYTIMAQEVLAGLDWEFARSLTWYRNEQYTLHFEIVHKDDPHICFELPGAYLIGCKMANGFSRSERDLDDMAYDLDAMRPGHFVMSFGEMKELIHEVQHEGFMILNLDTGNTMFKWKSPFYLTKKFLMRMSKHKAREMFEDKIKFKMSLDEEFYGVFDFIMENYNLEAWMNLNDQDRRAVMEEYMYG